MPVFINEVVIRASVEPAAGRSSAPPGQPAGDEPVDRKALIAEVKQAVMDYLERELDRIGER
ncbi:MAG: hypothetical protein GC201_15120 [Alphaproteobacteria bacterium]|nr:hypothetical protein [Alphaproteobacteria bacterium]